MNSNLFTHLSPRELQVLRYYSDGLTEKEIARKLGVTHNTVKHYGDAIRTRLNAFDKAHAVAIGFRHNLLT